MRAFLFLLAALALHGLTGCAQILMAQDSTTTDARGKFKKCTAENGVTAEGQALSTRLWMEDGSDDVEKLLDSNPLTPAERTALIQFHNKALLCRQIITTNVDHSASSSFFQDHARRSDAIYSKLANGQIPVGLANRLSIESDRKLLVDLANGHVDGLRPEEAARQRAMDEMIEASNRLTAAQPQSTTAMPSCTWLGNSLYCTAAH
jgi:hypothetical protein